MTITVTAKRINKNKVYLERLTPYVIVANQRKAKLLKSLIKGNTYRLINPNRTNSFYIVSPSAKKEGYIQATYFYDNNPVSDICRLKMDEIASEMVLEGFTNIERMI